MNDHIMNHEIAKSVKCESQAYEKKIVDPSFHAIVKKHDAGYGENHKENIVPLENSSVFRLVVIGVKIPHQTVHNILMSQPGHTFHKKENT